MALFLAHVEPTSDTTPEVGSRRAAMESGVESGMEFMLRMGGTWAQTVQPGRHPYRTFEWHRAVVMAGTPLWILALGWQVFDDAVPVEEQPDPPWKFMVELWDNDVSDPDHDATGKQVMEQIQTRDFDLVAHMVQTILDHADADA